MSKFPVGAKVIISNYGGDDASRNDKLYNGVVGKVIENHQRYHRVRLDTPVNGKNTVLCDPVTELELIEE